MLVSDKWKEPKVAKCEAMEEEKGMDGQEGGAMNGDKFNELI